MKSVCCLCPHYFSPLRVDFNTIRFMSWVDWCRNDRCDTFQQSHRGSVQAGCSVAFSESPWELSTAARRAEMWEVHFPRLPRSSLTAAFPTIIQKCELLLKKLIHKPVHLPFPAVFAARGAGQGLTLCVSRFLWNACEENEKARGTLGTEQCRNQRMRGVSEQCIMCWHHPLTGSSFHVTRRQPGRTTSGGQKKKRCS